MTIDLFVGLVTHPNSRFPEAVTTQGLMAQTAQGASDAGLTVTTGVSQEDAFSEESLPIDRRSVSRSVAAELAAERKWRRYLRGGREPWWAGTFIWVRHWIRVLRNSWLGPGSSSVAAHQVRRLANIEMSHLCIMDMGLASLAEWVLVLEDDAWTSNGQQFGALLADFIRAVSKESKPRMVSLSESFTPADLGISEILSPVSDSRGPWLMHSADRAITNTLCATLYRRNFLELVVAMLHEIPLEPVIPIDFKLDMALIRIADYCEPGDSWIATPAPVEQRSGVPRVRFG